MSSHEQSLSISSRLSVASGKVYEAPQFLALNVQVTCFRPAFVSPSLIPVSECPRAAGVWGSHKNGVSVGRGSTEKCNSSHDMAAIARDQIRPTLLPEILAGSACA